MNYTPLEKNILYEIIEKNIEIIEVLKISGQPMKAHEVWKESKFRNDIDEFYAELRRVVEETKNVEQEVRSDQETYLSLAEKSWKSCE